MKNDYKYYNLTLPIMIGIAPEYLSEDVAMLDLLTGVGDKNDSQYSKESFIKEIKRGNVVVVLLKDDPVAYAVINKEDEIAEMYIEYSFRDKQLVTYIKEFVDESRS